MKKLFLSLLLCGFVTGVALAQDQKQDPAEWDNKVKTELALTEEQSAKYDVVVKECREKIDAVAKDATLTPEAQKEKKMELKKEKQAKLFEFFTPAQQVKYNELIEKKKAGKDDEKS